MLHCFHHFKTNDGYWLLPILYFLQNGVNAISLSYIYRIKRDFMFFVKILEFILEVFSKYFLGEK